MSDQYELGEVVYIDIDDEPHPAVVIGFDGDQVLLALTYLTVDPTTINAAVAA